MQIVPVEVNAKNAPTVIAAILTPPLVAIPDVLQTIWIPGGRNPHLILIQPRGYFGVDAIVGTKILGEVKHMSRSGNLTAVMIADEQYILFVFQNRRIVG